MSIVITRVGDLYEATIRPPHGGGSPWSSLQPMTADSLIDALRDRGCHETDNRGRVLQQIPSGLAGSAELRI